MSKNPEVLLKGDHYIACPQHWFTELLEKFYGCHLDFAPPPDDQLSSVPTNS